MRKQLARLGSVGLAAAVIWLLVLLCNVSGPPKGEVRSLVVPTKAPPRALVAEATPPVVADLPPEKEVVAERPAAFARLPVGQRKPVDLEMSGSTGAVLSPREQGDQLRDWLLYLVVKEAGLTPDEFNRALFDVPAVRHGFVEQVANFEFGPTRSCVIGDGEVVALVPRWVSEEERKDQLAHVADEQRKNLGRIPERVHVFEYGLAVRGQRGSLTRLADVDGKELFTAEYGYHEKQVSDLDALSGFLTKVQDVTCAKKSGGGLLLGGRKLLARAYRGFRPEDVAAVWQIGRAHV